MNTITIFFYPSLLIHLYTFQSWSLVTHFIHSDGVAIRAFDPFWVLQFHSRCLTNSWISSVLEWMALIVPSFFRQKPLSMANRNFYLTSLTLDIFYTLLLPFFQRLVLRNGAVMELQVSQSVHFLFQQRKWKFIGRNTLSVWPGTESLEKYHIFNFVTLRLFSVF